MKISESVYPPQAYVSEASGGSSCYKDFEDSCQQPFWSELAHPSAWATSFNTPKGSSYWQDHCFGPLITNSAPSIPISYWDELDSYFEKSCHSNDLVSLCLVESEWVVHSLDNMASRLLDLGVHSLSTATFLVFPLAVTGFLFPNFLCTPSWDLHMHYSNFRLIRNASPICPFSSNCQYKLLLWV